MRKKFYRLFLIIFLILSAIGVFAKTPFGKTRSCAEKSVKVLMLGAYYIANMRLDAKNLEADDVLLTIPRRFINDAPQFCFVEARDYLK